MRKLMVSNSILSGKLMEGRNYLYSLFILTWFMLSSMESAASEITRIQTESDTIEFSGYRWIVKDSYENRVGPGDNFFSGSRENVHVDDSGKLHMKITFRNNKWYCPEVRLLEPLGYGRFYFYLDSLPQELDKNVVIGMFVYDMVDTSNSHNEIDIEFSHWGNTSKLNSQYVIQPFEEKAYRFSTDLSLATRHMIELKKKKITFSSGYLRTDKNLSPIEYAHFRKKPEKAYKTKDERAIINVWLFQSTPPASQKEFEVIISRFEFKQCKWYQ